MREAGQPPGIWLAWAAYLVVIGYSLCTSHWTMAAQGINRVREVQAAIFWGAAGYLVLGVVLLVSGGGLFSMVAAVGARGIIIRLLCRRAYQRAVGDESEKPSTDPDIVRRLWPNAYKFGVMSLGAYLISNANVFICSQLLDNAMTASYGLTLQVGNFTMSLAGLWLAVKWPHITILRTQGQIRELSVLFARRFFFTMASYVVLATLAVLLANPVLEWKGSHTLLLATPCLVFYLTYLGLQLFYVQFGLLAFTENVIPFFKIALYTGVGLVTLSLVLTPTLGVWGMLLAPLIAEWSCSGWFTIRRGFQGQGLTVYQFWRAAITGHL